MNNENTFSGIIDKVDKEFIDSFKTNNKMIKDCKTCIHNRVCSHKDKNEEYKQQMEQLIEKWGEDSGFGFTEDCPEWHSQPSEINIDSRKHVTDWLKKDKPLKYKPISARNTNTKPMTIKFDNLKEDEILEILGKIIS